MRAVVQRVRGATVQVGEQPVAAIGQGLLVLLGVAKEDSLEDSTYLARKLSGLRIFEDPQGKMNLSVQDIQGEILVVPQFTLLGDCRHGRRPDFASAASPEKGFELFTAFCRQLSTEKAPVKTGSFREHMQVKLENDGPVTLVLDSKLK